MRFPTSDRPLPTRWLVLALVLDGAAACSVDPLMPGSTGGTGGGAAGQGGTAGTSASGGTTGNAGANGLDCGPVPPVAPCPFGTAIVVCTVDATGSPYWKVSCSDNPMGNGGAGGAAGTSGGGGAGGAAATACTSSDSCAMGEVCTTVDGVCNAAPGCGVGTSCPAVCYGTCRAAATDGPICGGTRCTSGMVCCNDSCGICTAPNVGCTKQLCVPPSGAGACMTDADCRLEADYCTGCDCRALATGQSLPPCSGPGVRCIADPCSGGRRARCVNGTCAVQ
jgi:hypothetical protein